MTEHARTLRGSHRLTKRDPAGRMAVCATCGLGPIFYRQGRWMCAARKALEPEPWYYTAQPQVSNPKVDWWTWPGSPFTGSMDDWNH